MPSGGHAHQADERDVRRARLGEQRGQLGDRAAAFLRLLADVDLDEARHPAAGLVHRLGQRGDQARPVERMDAVEQRHGIVRLVRSAAGRRGAARPPGQRSRKRGPLALRFLHAVLAEHLLAGFEQRLDRLGGMGLADRDQRHLVRLAPRHLAGMRDALLGPLRAGWLRFP